MTDGEHRYIMWFRLADGTEDCIFVDGTSIEDVREKAKSELYNRGATYMWSERYSEERVWTSD